MYFAKKKQLFITICTFFAAIILLLPNVSFAESWKEASNANKEDCNMWCKANTSCVKCVTSGNGCGRGFEVIKKWKGPGIDYAACEKQKLTQSTVDSRDSCIDWCRLNRSCVKCVSSTHGCGRSYKTIRHWNTDENRYMACERR